MNHKQPEPKTISNEQSSRRSAVSGEGMDRVVATKAPWYKAYLPYLVAFTVFVAGYLVVNSSGARALNVDQQRISIATVTRGTFEDFIPVRGRVTPARTVFLDAMEGGRVERIHVEDGVPLKAGDLIVELSNTSLLLNVTRNEAMVAEQLNNMRTIELSLQQNRLQHKRNLVDISYQIKMLTRQLKHERELLTTNAIAQNKVDDTRDTLQWYKQRREVTLESQKTDSSMQEQQLAFLKATGNQLEKNLNISRQNLENMRVRAPVDGKLSGFDVEIGQSINRGGRLGQIDTPDDFKLTALIDEFYLGRVDIGYSASYQKNGKSYQLRISKIYPQVRNGEFEVDFKFVEQQPSEIRRGQTLQLKLTLGDAELAQIIPNASFYQTSGGNWIYVLTADGNEAIKRDIKTGRRNNSFIEVLSGLEDGERVITSSYTAYQQIERLNLQN